MSQMKNDTSQMKLKWHEVEDKLQVPWHKSHVRNQMKHGSKKRLKKKKKQNETKYMQFTKAGQVACNIQHFASDITYRM